MLEPFPKAARAGSSCKKHRAASRGSRVVGSAPHPALLQPPALLCCWSQGWLLIHGAALQDPSSFIPISQPGFSSLTLNGGRGRVGKLRHEVAAGCRQRLMGFVPLCITKRSCSGSCHSYPGAQGSSIAIRDP